MKGIGDGCAEVRVGIMVRVGGIDFEMDVSFDVSAGVPVGVAVANRVQETKTIAKKTKRSFLVSILMSICDKQMSLRAGRSGGLRPPLPSEAITLAVLEIASAQRTGLATTGSS